MVVARRAFKAEQHKQYRLAHIRDQPQQPPARIAAVVQTAHADGACGQKSCQHKQRHHGKRQLRRAQIALMQIAQAVHAVQLHGKLCHQPNRQRTSNADLHQRKTPIFLAPCASVKVGVLFEHGEIFVYFVLLFMFSGCLTIMRQPENVFLAQNLVRNQLFF